MSALAIKLSHSECVAKARTESALPNSGTDKFIGREQFVAHRAAVLHRQAVVASGSVAPPNPPYPPHASDENEWSAWATAMATHEAENTPTVLEGFSSKERYVNFRTAELRGDSKRITVSETLADTLRRILTMAAVAALCLLMGFATGAIAGVCGAALYWQSKRR